MDLFWPMFFFMAFVVIIMIFATISEVINKLGNIAKWLGLGAIAGNVINNKTWSDEVVTIRLGQTQRWNMPLPLGLFAYIKIKS